MKVAVIGSRGLHVDHLGDYLPAGVTEIVSGGARGIDTCAKNYALTHSLKLTEFLPEYGKYSAELDPEEKNRISHRGKALEEMKKVLRQESL